VFRWTSEPWLTVLSEAWLTAGVEPPSFAEMLHQRLNRPVIQIVAEDGQATELEVFVDGEQGKLAVQNGQRTADSSPDEHWSQLMKRMARSIPSADRWKIGNGLRDAVSMLRIDPSRFHVMAVDFEERFAPPRHVVIGRPLPWEAGRVVSDASVPPGAIGVPAFCCARSADVRRSWRKVLKAAFARGAWGDALQRIPLVATEDAPHMLILTGPVFDNADDRDNVLIFVIGEVFGAEASRVSHSGNVERLFLEALNELWFVLGCCAFSHPVLPRSRDPERRRSLALQTLRGFMAHWENLVVLQSRYYGGDWLPLEWPQWAKHVWIQGADAGIPQDVLRTAWTSDPPAAGRIVRNWLAKQDRGRPPVSRRS
jgi:hypothetical protein